MTAELHIGIIWPDQITAQQAQPAHRRQPLTPASWTVLSRRDALRSLTSLPLAGLTAEQVRERITRLAPGETVSFTAATPGSAGVSGRLLVQAA